MMKIPPHITPQLLVRAWGSESVCSYLDSNDKINPCGYNSIVGLNPFLHLIYQNGKVSLHWFDGQKVFLDDFWGTMGNLLAHFQVHSPCQNEFPLGAAIGYMSYDLGLELEGIKSYAKSSFGWPLAEFSFYDLLFCFNNSKDSYIISTGLPFVDTIKRKKNAQERLQNILQEIEKRNKIEKVHEKSGIRDSRQGFKGALRSNFSYESYVEAIQKIKSYICAGDVYQVNLSQSFMGEISEEGWAVYQHLREINPVPYGAYLRFGNREVLCFSMERFLKMLGDFVETRPIKGTRPRGKNGEEDMKLRQELYESPKDRAELVMIVDMERNDLGKVCRPGTVKVQRLFEVEQYATVFHLVSTITGELGKGINHLDCLKACLPGGSITGAPKYRAMEIIDELEGIKREVYCGAIGYFGFNKMSDFNIPIRTIFKEGRKIQFNSGGGILFDSEPDAEYKETIHKVRSFLECFLNSEIQV